MLFTCGPTPSPLSVPLFPSNPGCVSWLGGPNQLPSYKESWGCGECGGRKKEGREVCECARLSHLCPNPQPTPRPPDDCLHLGKVVNRCCGSSECACYGAGPADCGCECQPFFCRRPNSELSRRASELPSDPEGGRRVDGILGWI